jgi:hypothetical protein
MRLTSLLAIGSLAYFAVSASALAPHPHHHLHHALWELRDAHKELTEAKHDFGGHRDNALHAVDDAIKQIDLALKNPGNSITGVPTRGDIKEMYRRYKHNPHMHHALVECKHAHRQLKEAHHDFGGHRKAALRDVHYAIGQIELCLKNHKS